MAEYLAPKGQKMRKPFNLNDDHKSYLESKKGLSADVQKKPVSLSFSISRILSVSDDKVKRSVPEAAIPRGHHVLHEVPRVPHIGTVHHYAPNIETDEPTHFELAGHPRACSTPESDEFPSPTPAYPPLQHGHLSYPLSYHHSPSFQFNHSHSIRNISSPDTLQTEVPLKPNVKCFENCNDKSLDSLGESYQNSPSPLKIKKKKTRTVFSRSQIYQLETAFDMKRYLSSAERSGLAARLNLSETQIKIWFQNRRNKWKRQINGEMDEIPIPPAFAAGFLSQQSYCPPSLNSMSHVMDPSEDLLRSRLAASAYYSHPYSHDQRRPLSYLS